MVRLSDFALDMERVNQGTWVDWAKTGIRFRVRLADSRVGFRDRLLEGYRAHEGWRRENLSNLLASRWIVDSLVDDEREFWSALIAEELVTDWDGVDAEDGEGAESYTPDGLARRISTLAFRELFEFLLRVSLNSGLFRAKRAEAERGKP
ncbi:hypothetical protein [Engelhardtia mirabilis]|uniref:Uncharacterized protein n=1 Tax=Engelhardtia mirabilis TaxID=2528011 RepID=A0A518BL58_9BACT|nr:hypothetical protein Pla133_28000 [Planctomycetes bacterium Pla133]QDV02038.1 hypothetical protein Pla86_27990 [Planctomycetes bacterium Pla86]